MAVAARGDGTVRGYLQPFRELGAAPPAVPAPPKARDVASWILRDPDTLDDHEKARLAQARDRCPHLDALAGRVTEFAKILTGRHGDRLDDWIAAVEADDQPDLHSFARGLRHDYDAVRNGLSPALELRSRGRHRQQDQDDQAPDVRLCRLTAAPQARPRCHLKGLVTITKYGSDPVGVDTATAPSGRGSRALVVCPFL
jgi:hypothetical protein